MHWFTVNWWKYLLGTRYGDRGIILTARCRAKGHPAGVQWYSHGIEPDMHCRFCGDDLG